MSSWLVSLRCLGRSIGEAGRGLEKNGLRAPRILYGLFNAGPRWLVAEMATQELQQCHDLLIVHAIGESRHDRAAFAIDRAHARQHDIDGIAWIGAAQRSAQGEIDTAIGQCTTALMAGSASCCKNRGASLICRRGLDR